MRAERFHELKHYLQDREPDQSRGGAALLGALLSMQRRGVKMDVKKLN